MGRERRAHYSHRSTGSWPPASRSLPCVFFCRGSFGPVWTPGITGGWRQQGRRPPSSPSRGSLSSWRTLGGTISRHLIRQHMPGAQLSCTIPIEHDDSVTTLGAPTQVEDLGQAVAHGWGGRKVLPTRSFMPNGLQGMGSLQGPQW